MMPQSKLKLCRVAQVFIVTSTLRCEEYIGFLFVLLSRRETLDICLLRNTKGGNDLSHFTVPAHFWLVLLVLVPLSKNLENIRFNRKHKNKKLMQTANTLFFLQSMFQGCFYGSLQNFPLKHLHGNEISKAETDWRQQLFLFSLLFFKLICYLHIKAGVYPP